MSFGTKLETFLTERNLFRAFIAFLVLAAIIRVGYFPVRVMEFDQTMSGPFLAHLLAYPDLYDNDPVMVVRPVGFITFMPLVEGMLLRMTGLDPIIPSYFFTVAGNVFFVLALFAYARLFLSDIHAMAAALLAYTLRIDAWSLAIMTNLQIYPTATDTVSAVVILAFTAVMRERWFLAIALLLGADILHPVFGVFATIPCFLAAFFDRTATWKTIAMRQVGFGAVIFLGIAIPFVVMAISEKNQASVDYFLPLLYGLTGHANAWLNTKPFLEGLLCLIACVIGFTIFSKPETKLTVTLFWCVTGTVIAVCIAQWVGIWLQMSFSAPLGLGAAARCSVFIAYLAFPVLYRGVALAILDRMTIRHRLPKGLPYALLAIAALATFVDCVFIGETSHSPFLKDEIAVSKWMQSTPPKTHFLVTDRALQQDSFALRPTAFPLPYLISMAYRIRDERSIAFDQDMVRFWGPSGEHGRRWVNKYWDDIEYNRMQHMTEQETLALSRKFSSQYFVTRKTAAPLSWPMVHETTYYVIYKIPKGQVTN